MSEDFKVATDPLLFAKVIIEKWRHFYNHERPHSALGNKTLAQVSGAFHVA
jgi:transposase InsO family protein